MDRRGKKFLKRCKTRHFQFASGDEIERGERNWEARKERDPGN